MESYSVGDHAIDHRELRASNFFALYVKMTDPSGPHKVPLSNLHIKTIQHSCEALTRKAAHTKRNHFVNTVLIQ